MIPSIRISGNRGIIRSKLTWLLVGLCVATFLAIVRWPKEAKKEPIKTEQVEEPKDEVIAEVPVTQQWAPDEPEEVELDIVKTLQGVVTDYDPCIQLLTVEGFFFDTGPVDLTGIRAGDVVKAHYIEKKLGRRKVNVLKSLELIAASQQRTAQSVIPDEEPFREPQEQEENEEFTEEEPLSEPGELETDIRNTMQGRVTDNDPCIQLFTVEGLHFDPGTVDLRGIGPGDYVEITYTEKQHGNVLDSVKQLPD